MKVRKTKKRKGNAYIIIIASMMVLSILVSVMFRQLNQATYESNLQNLKIKADYIGQLYTDAAIQALIDDDNDLLNRVGDKKPITESNIEHKDENGKTIAVVSISMIVEEHEYFGKEMEWVAITVRTSILDDRPNAQGQIGERIGYTSYSYVLKDDPSIRVFDKKLN